MLLHEELAAQEARLKHQIGMEKEPEIEEEMIKIQNKRAYVRQCFFHAVNCFHG